MRSDLSLETKTAARRAVNRVFSWAEREGLTPKTGGFVPDHLATYPALRLVEQAHPEIKTECDRLLGHMGKLTKISELGGGYTRGGIHEIRWRCFVLKQGRFLAENCRACPSTAEVLRHVPGVETAFFSILEPRQHIRPHWGYYKGFLRYHLGVRIPGRESCWLRVNDDPADNASRDRSRVENGQKFYWREGEGVLFDDTYLHDAANESDEPRVVLWLDVRRRLPPMLDAFNAACLAIARLDPTLRRIHQVARVDGLG